MMNLPPELLKKIQEANRERVREEQERLDKPTTAEAKYRKHRKKRNRIPKMSRRKNRR